MLLRNLLDNAVRYSPDGAQVRLQVAQAQGFTELTVEDSGPGLAPNNRQGWAKGSSACWAQARRAAAWDLPIVQRIARIHRLQINTDTSPELGACA